MGYIIDGVLARELNADGWMTVRDVGYEDEEGFIYIVGREKNMILFGGINIFPEEIESVLHEHPAVDEIVVIGVEDSYWGEKPVAIVKGSVTKQQLKVFAYNDYPLLKYRKNGISLMKYRIQISGKIARITAKSMIENREKIYE